MKASTPFCQLYTWARKTGPQMINGFRQWSSHCKGRLDQPYLQLELTFPTALSEFLRGAFTIEKGAVLGEHADASPAPNRWVAIHHRIISLFLQKGTLFKTRQLSGLCPANGGFRNSPKIPALISVNTKHLREHPYFFFHFTHQ